MSEARLFIVRHGNTFGPGETPLRVGCGTDIPLVDSGIEQARALGKFFGSNGIKPELIIAGELRRAQETARIICESGDFAPQFESSADFNEIDYGPDEGRTEEDVVSRVGQEAIDLWNSDAVVPDGWRVRPAELIEAWRKLAARLERECMGKTAIVVTSNGVARFAPYITRDYESFKQNYPLKLKTGAFGEFAYSNNVWTALRWNVRPS